MHQLMLKNITCTGNTSKWIKIPNFIFDGAHERHLFELRNGYFFCEIGSFRFYDIKIVIRNEICAEIPSN